MYNVFLQNTIGNCKKRKICWMGLSLNWDICRKPSRVNWPICQVNVCVDRTLHFTWHQGKTTGLTLVLRLTLAASTIVFFTDNLNKNIFYLCGRQQFYLFAWNGNLWSFFFISTYQIFYWKCYLLLMTLVTYDNLFWQQKDLFWQQRFIVQVAIQSWSISS